MSTPAPSGWSPVEVRLWEAVRDGVPLDLTTGNSDRADAFGSDIEIAADVLARVMLKPPDVIPGTVAAVHLVGARVVGPLSLGHAVVDVPVILTRCQFDESVQLDGARVRVMDLSGSRFPAFGGDGLQVDGDLNLSAVNSGSMSLFRATIDGNVWLTAAEIDGQLNAPQLTVTGGIYARSMTARGRVNLWGARAFTVELDQASLTSDDDTALRMTGIHLGQNFEGSQLSVAEGGVDMFGATIGGQVRLEHSRLRNTRGWALRGAMLVVGGNVYGRGMAAVGGVDLAGASIGASIELPAATLTAPGRYALSAPAIRTGGRISLNSGACIDGAVALHRSTINSTLSFSGAKFADGGTVELEHATISTLTMTALRQPPGMLDLRTTTIATIEDDPDCWPANIKSAMCSYQSLHPLLSATQRLQWLQRTDEPYHPQPYEQLANHYRRIGHDDEARLIAVVRHRRRRRGRPLVQRFWSYLEDATIGYGYRPARALTWLIAVTAAAAVVFANNPPRPTQPDGPPFQPAIYALDVVLPILDLNQERAFVPVGVTQWVAWACSLAGWFLATTTIAGLTRRLARTQ